MLLSLRLQSYLRVLAFEFISHEYDVGGTAQLSGGR
jgi:hypothetical protein